MPHYDTGTIIEVPICTHVYRRLLTGLTMGTGDSGIGFFKLGRGRRPLFGRPLAPFLGPEIASMAKNQHRHLACCQHACRPASQIMMSLPGEFSPEDSSA